MKTIGWVILVLLVFVLFVPNNAFCMGWFEPWIPGGGSGDPGPVSAPEPGTITLIGMALSAGAGYLLGKRKK